MKYAIIDKNGNIESIDYSAKGNFVEVEDSFDPTDKKWDSGRWIEDKDKKEESKKHKEKDELEILIQEKLREIAIEALTAEGKI